MEEDEEDEEGGRKRKKRKKNKAVKFYVSVMAMTMMIATSTIT